MATDIMKGFEVMDIEKASTQAAMTVTETKLRFNKATAHELTYPEYAVMSMNPTTHQVAVQGSTEGTRNAFLFAEKGTDTRYSITVNIMALSNSIRKMMGWNDDAEHTAHGVYYAAADAIIFEMDTAVRGEKRYRRKKSAAEQTDDATDGVGNQNDEIVDKDDAYSHPALPDSPSFVESVREQPQQNEPQQVESRQAEPKPPEIIPAKRKPGRPRKNV